MPRTARSSASPTVYIALLRGINVGGHNKVAMADLRALVSGLDFTRARSVLQSGNLVFAAAEPVSSNVERRLETEMQRAFGFGVDFFVRTRAEWESIVRDNPFQGEAEADPAHLLAMPLKAAPQKHDVAELQRCITGCERVAVVGACAYVVYPDGIGRSKVTNAALDRALGTRGTGRNWTTVLKLAELAREL